MPILPARPLRLLPWVLLLNALLVLAIVQRHVALERSWQRYHAAAASLEAMECRR